MTLSEGSRLSLTIPLDPTTTAPKVAVALQAASRRGPQEKPPRPLPQAERPEGHGHSALGAVAIVAGGALLVGSGVVLLLRHAAISDLQSSCSGGCPPAREAELTSERSRALFEGPLAVGLSAAGVIAAGVGLYFVLQPGESSPAAPAPGAAKSRSRPTVANLRVLPVLSREGAMLGIGGSF